MHAKQKLGGVAALIAAATLVIGIGMFATLLSDLTTGDPTPSESAAFVADHYGTLYVWNLITMVVFAGALVPLGLALYHRLKAGSPALAETGSVFALIWAALLFGAGLVTLVDLGTVAGLADSDPAGAASAWIALESVEKGLGGTIEIVGGLWVLLISLAALRAGVFPKALNYVGVFISVGAFATMVPAFELVGVIFGLGLIVWLGWLGVVMYRGSPSATMLPGDRSEAVAIGDRLTDSPSDRRTFA
jgi:hypothetical protein